MVGRPWQCHLQLSGQAEKIDLTAAAALLLLLTK
jgi:hypothetical protein